MGIQKIYIVLVMMAIVVTGCMQDDFDELGGGSAPGESGSVLSLATGRTDGLVNLAVDAPQAARSGVWIDLDGDGVRAGDGMEDITVFGAYRNYKFASGLKAISVYGDITYFAAASNELTALDVSRNPFLETLNVPLNRLGSLDLSKNTALARLDCSGNSLPSLDVSQNRSLVSLWAFDNRLSALNVSGNTALAFLDCSGNKLATLDVTQNSELVRLLCYNNQISSLDISQNGKLNRLWAFGNLFSADETARIIDALQEVLQGDLWSSAELVSAGQAEILAAKGWMLNN